MTAAIVKMERARDLAAIEADRLARGEVLKASDSFEIVWAAFDAEHIGPTFRPGTAAMWRRVYPRQWFDEAASACKLRFFVVLL